MWAWKFLLRPGCIDRGTDYPAAVAPSRPAAGDKLASRGHDQDTGEPGPVGVQGVPHVFYPPLTLAAWPSDERRSRLVFITRDVPEQAVSALVDAGALDRPTHR